MDVRTLRVILDALPDEWPIDIQLRPFDRDHYDPVSRPQVIDRVMIVPPSNPNRVIIYTEL